MTTLGSHADEFVHPALFYRGIDEYLEGTVSFIRAGLAAGEPVAVAVPGSNLRFILAELGTDAERVTPLDMTRVGRNPGRIIPGVLCTFADAHPTGRVRIVGEPIWAGRTGVEYPACAQHEALINLAFAGRPVTVLCPYDVERLDAQVLADAEVTHPLLVDASGARESADYAPERIIATYNRLLPAPVAPKIAFDATTLAQIRRFVTEQATRLGLGGDHPELELLVGELTANSVAHGGGTGTLSIWAEEGQLVCEVRDAGHITDPLAGRRRVDRNQLTGRGLLLVNHLADLVRMYTGPGGTTVRLYVALPGQNGHPADLGAVARATQASGTMPVGHGSPQSRAPLRWQTRDALRAASRFARYLPHDGVASPQQDVERRDVERRDVERRDVESRDVESRDVESRDVERCQLQPVLEALAAADVLVQVVELWRTRLVQLARRRGARWTEIGRALGVSKQAAHERYSGTRRRAANRGTVR